MPKSVYKPHPNIPRVVHDKIFWLDEEDNDSFTGQLTIMGLQLLVCAIFTAISVIAVGLVCGIIDGLYWDDPPSGWDPRTTHAILGVLIGAGGMYLATCVLPRIIWPMKRYRSYDHVTLFTLFNELAPDDQEVMSGFYLNAMQNDTVVPDDIMLLREYRDAAAQRAQLMAPSAAPGYRQTAREIIDQTLESNEKLAELMKGDNDV